MFDKLHIIFEVNNNGPETDVDEPVEFTTMVERVVT